MKRNQKGFTIIEISLALLVVTVVAFGGYFAWHSQHKTKSTVSNSASTTTSQAEQTQIFKIPEVKLQLTIPTSLTTLKYQAIQNDAGKYSFLFTDNRLSGPNCNKNEAGGLSEIDFAEVTQSIFGPSSSTTTYKKLGDVYWSLNTFQETSCSNGATADAIVIEDIQFLKSAWSTLTSTY